MAGLSTFPPLAALLTRRALRRALVIVFGVVPAVIGWAWAFNHFALTYFLINGVVFAAVIVGTRWAMRLTMGKATSGRRQAVLFAAIAGGLPAAFITWPMLALSHPNAYLAVCSSALGFLGYRAVQGIRRVVSDLRADFA